MTPFLLSLNVFADVQLRRIQQALHQPYQTFTGATSQPRPVVKKHHVWNGPRKPAKQCGCGRGIGYRATRCWSCFRANRNLRKVQRVSAA